MGKGNKKEDVIYNESCKYPGLCADCPANSGGRCTNEKSVAYGERVENSDGCRYGAK